MEILLVEASATLRANMASTLHDMGHRVHHAESGEKCLHMIEACLHDPHYDLILMDVELPGLDGFETTRLLREILPHWIPIIFVTAVTDEASYAKGIEAGGDDYLAKPLSGVILKAKIAAMERIAGMQQSMSRLNRALRSASERDALTHLLNRRAFTRKAESCWRRYRNGAVTTAVIMLDVDHFKPYNDTYGHLEGDRCLRRIAAALRAALRGHNHLAGRYGGEEFIVLLPDTSADQARHIAEAIRRGVYDLAIEHLTSPAQRITISAGVAVTNSLANHSLDQLIVAADKQLYRVKNTDRNRVSWVDLDAHKTILICVSDLDDQIYLSHRLANRANIVTAEDGAECVEIASYIIPDLLVVGSAVRLDQSQCPCGDLRLRESTAAIPVVLLRESCGPPSCHRREHCMMFLCDRAGVPDVVDRFIH